MEKIRENVILRGSDPLGVRSHLTGSQIFGANFREPKFRLYPKHQSGNCNFLSHANLSCERLATGKLRKEHIMGLIDVVRTRFFEIRAHSASVTGSDPRIAGGSKGTICESHR